MKRSIGITIFGWCMIIVGFSSILSFFRISQLQKGIYIYIYIIYFLSLVCIGIGILKLKRWARFLLFCLLAIKVVDIFFRSAHYLLELHTKIIGFVDIVGTLIIGVLIVWFFNRKPIKEQFIP